MGNTTVAQGPNFFPTKAFPPSDKSRLHLVHFLLSSQGLASVLRVLPLLPEEAGSAKIFLMTYSIGMAHEAALAFEDADKWKAFADIDQSEEKVPKRALAGLRAEIADPHSVTRKRMLISRNQLGFHWDLRHTRRALEDLKELCMPSLTYEVGRSISASSASIPMVEFVIEAGLGSVAGDPKEVVAMMDAIAAFQSRCLEVSYAAYILALEKEGVGPAGLPAKHPISGSPTP